MKKIGSLGYIILGLITTSAFAQSSSSPTVAPSAEKVHTASAGKHKKGGKKHGHHAHKRHKKDKAGSEQK